jgi:hypothetical protein
MNKTLATVFVASFCLPPCVIFAQQRTPSPSPSPLSPIYACAEKTDATERLACFDTAVAAVKAAEGRSEIIAMDKPRVEAVRREAFGFRIPSLPKFGLGGAGATGTNLARGEQSKERDAEFETQTFAVTRLGQSGDRVAIYLDNGNVWHLVEAGELFAPRQFPFNVQIRAASMGSFILQVEGRNKGYRVRRVQ